MPSKSKGLFPALKNENGCSNGTSARLSRLPGEKTKDPESENSTSAKLSSHPNSNVPYIFPVEELHPRPYIKGRSFLGPREQRLLHKTLLNNSVWVDASIVDANSVLSKLETIPPLVSYKRSECPDLLPCVEISDPIFFERDREIQPIYPFPRQLDGEINYSCSPPLPQGLELDEFSGVIYGFPQVATCETVSDLPPICKWTFLARDSRGQVVQRLLLQFVILDPPGKMSYENPIAIYQLGLEIAPNAPSGLSGRFLRFEAEPPLPVGLNFDGNGFIRGTPQEAQDAIEYTILAINAVGISETCLSIRVDQELPTLRYPQSLIDGLVGQPLELAPVPTGRMCRPEFLTLPGLPLGVHLEQGSGRIHGTPEAGTEQVVRCRLGDHRHVWLAHRLPLVVRCWNAVSKRWAELRVSVTKQPELRPSHSSVTFLLGKFSTPVMMEGSYGPGIRFRVSPRLPRGLVINPRTGTLSGVPREICADGSSFTVFAEDAKGGATAAQLSIRIGVLDVPQGLSYRLSKAVYCVGRRGLFGNREGLLERIRRDWSRQHYRTAVYLQRSFRRRRLHRYLGGILKRWRRSVMSRRVEKLQVWWRRVMRQENLEARLEKAGQPAKPADSILLIQDDREVESKADGQVKQLRQSILQTQHRDKPNTALAVITPAAFVSRRCGAPRREAFRFAGGAHESFLIRSVSDVREGPVKRLNHMGLPGLRGCGKGNWVASLRGGGPWVFSVEPPLPPGLELDPRNGCIVGAPTSAFVVTSFQITASNKMGSVTTEVELEGLDPPIPPSYPEYQSGPQLVWAINRQLSSGLVQSSGTPPLDFSCEPGLPNGLSIERRTGTIQGICRCPVEMDVAIICENVAGVASCTIRLILQKPPEMLVYWTCRRYRNQQDEEDLIGRPSLVFARGVVIDDCRVQRWKGQPIAAEKLLRRGMMEKDLRAYRWHLLSRPLRHFVCKVFPLCGTGVHFRSEPQLPQGLELDPSTGCISGAPAHEISPPQVYRIIAENHVGSTFCDVKIEVLVPPHTPTYQLGLGGAARYLSGEDFFLPPPLVEGTPPFVFGVYPELPGNLQLNIDGSISGKVSPVAPVYFCHFSIKIKNQVGRSFGRLSLVPETCLLGLLIDTTCLAPFPTAPQLQLTRMSPNFPKFRARTPVKSIAWQTMPRGKLMSSTTAGANLASPSPRRLAAQLERQELNTFLTGHRVPTRRVAAADAESSGYFFLRADPGIHMLQVAASGLDSHGIWLQLDFAAMNMVSSQQQEKYVSHARKLQAATAGTNGTSAPEDHEITLARKDEVQSVKEELDDVGEMEEEDEEDETSDRIQKGQSSFDTLDTVNQDLRLSAYQRGLLCLLRIPSVAAGCVRVLVTWNAASFPAVEGRPRVWASWGDQVNFDNPRITDPSGNCTIQVLFSPPRQPVTGVAGLTPRFPGVILLEGLSSGDFNFNLSVSLKVVPRPPPRRRTTPVPVPPDARTRFLEEAAFLGLQAAAATGSAAEGPSVDSEWLALRVDLFGNDWHTTFLPKKDGFVRNNIWQCCTLRGREGRAIASKDAGRTVEGVEKLIEDEKPAEAEIMNRRLREEGGPEEELMRLQHAISALRKKVLGRGDAALDAARKALVRQDYKGATDQLMVAKSFYITAGVISEQETMGQTKIRRYDTEAMAEGVGTLYMQNIWNLERSIHNARVIQRCRQNLTARCLVLTFGAWRDQARNTKRLERIKDRVIRAWRAGSLRPAFYSLVANAERQTRVRKTLNRMRLMFIGRVLLEWRDMVAELLDLRASERRKLEDALERGRACLKLAEGIKNGKVYLREECYDVVFDIVLKATWFMAAVSSPRDTVYSWGFNAPVLIKVTPDQGAAAAITAANAAVAALSMEIFEVLASKVCEDCRIQGRFIHQIAESMYQQAVDWAGNPDRPVADLDINKVKRAVSDGLRHVKAAKQSDSPDQQVQKLVRELSGHVSDMERLLRSQVFEALELQKFMCRQVDKSLREADDMLIRERPILALKALNEGRRAMRRAGVPNLKPPLQGRATRPHASLIIARALKIKSATRRRFQSKGAMAQTVLGQVEAGGSGFSALEIMEGSNWLAKPSYSRLFGMMEWMCRQAVFTRISEAEVFESKAEACYVEGRAEDGLNVLARARNIWMDPYFFERSEEAVVIALQRVDALEGRLQNILSLAAAGRKSLKAAVQSLLALRLVDARQQLCEARDQLLEANVMWTGGPDMEQATEVQAKICAKEGELWRRGLSLLRAAAKAAARPGSGGCEKAREFIREGTEVLRLLGGPNRARALAMAANRPEGTPEPPLPPPEDESNDDQGEHVASDEEEDDLPPPPPLKTLEQDDGSSTGTGSSFWNMRRKHPGTGAVHGQDRRVVLPSFECGDGEDLSSKSLRQLAKSVDACTLYREIAEELQRAALRSVSCFAFEEARRLAAAASECLWRAHADSLDLEQLENEISKQVWVAFEQGSLLLKQARDHLHDLDAVPTPPETPALVEDVMEASFHDGHGLPTGEISPDKAIPSSSAGDGEVCKVIDGSSSSSHDVIHRNSFEQNSVISNGQHVSDIEMAQVSSMRDSSVANDFDFTEVFSREKVMPLVIGDKVETETSAGPVSEHEFASDLDRPVASGIVMDDSAEEATDAENVDEPLNEELDFESDDTEGSSKGPYRGLTGTGRVWEAFEALQRARFLLAAVGSYPLDQTSQQKLHLCHAEADELKVRVTRILAVLRRRDRAAPVRIEYPVAVGTVTLRCCQAMKPLKALVNGHRANGRYWKGRPGGILRFTVDPALPDGMQLDTATGEITGTPQVPLGGRFRLSVENELGAARTAITISVLPDGPVYGLAGLPSASLPLQKRVERLRLAGLDEEAVQEERRERRARIRRYLAPYPKSYTSTDVRRKNTNFSSDAAPDPMTERTRLQVMYRDYAFF